MMKTYRCTMVVSVLAVLFWAIPESVAWLEMDFRLIGDGQWWRIWTGHLTHYNGDHLFWDLLMFAALGAACERAYPRRFPLALATMMAGVSVCVGIVCDEIPVYRGLSGIDTGLFVWLAADQVRRCWIDRERVFAALWLSALVALIGKSVFEATTGQTLFVDSSEFTPLVESHLAGAVIGMFCAANWRRPLEQPVPLRRYALNRSSNRS